MFIIKNSLLVIFILCLSFFIKPSPASAQDYVVVLHGLARSSSSMDDLAQSLQKQGYKVLNLDYASRQDSIQVIAEQFLSQQIKKFCRDSSRQIHFVTHSMGGIVLRYYLTLNPNGNFGRAVLLSPPNNGSEVVDFLDGVPIVDQTMGPAFKQLSADSASFVNQLGPPPIEVGVITGDRSINLINSVVIPGADDGKVSLESAKLKGMKDFLVVHRTHPFIMSAPEVIEQVQYFLRNGLFFREKQ